MKIEVKVPSPGESITEVQIANWLVDDGAYVEKDDEVVEIDSDKATLSISAEESGAIKIEVEEGENVEVGAVIAYIDTEAEGKKKQAPEKKDNQSPPREKEEKTDHKAQEQKEETPAPREENEKRPAPADKKKEISESGSGEIAWHVSPLAKKLMEEHAVQQEDFVEFFKKHRVNKADVEYYLENKDAGSLGGATQKQQAEEVLPGSWQGARDEERKKMSTLRKKLSQRLVAVKNETAMLTTFNEVDMKPISDIRKKYKEKFKEKHGVSLGFMSFFTKAVTKTLALHPTVNAHLDGEEIIYHHYADVGIAVSSPKGLVVPVLRNAETMTLAQIESNIKDMATRARNNKITLDEMTGGTFTITNGGVFGSMLSTPIINPPQSAILGMHNILERPVAVEGKVEIRPVMYIALSYDHRVIDGKESVGFLYKVKEMLEDPAKLLLGGVEPEQKLLDL
jgi:2-oxoglutarate dehydrogenase E2 component (dihydrolipoamide succinyltransferase)